MVIRTYFIPFHHVSYNLKIIPDFSKGQPSKNLEHPNNVQGREHISVLVGALCPFAGLLNQRYPSSDGRSWDPTPQCNPINRGLIKGLFMGFMVVNKCK